MSVLTTADRIHYPDNRELRDSFLVDLTAGIVLFAAAAFFSISLLVRALDFGTFSYAHNTTFFTFGSFLYSVYGFSAIVIPVFVLVSGILCFLQQWSKKRGVYLACSVIPFLTLAVTERFCRKFVQEDAGTLLGIKIVIAPFICALVIAIEYLVAGILSDIRVKKQPREAKKPRKPAADTIILPETDDILTAAKTEAPAETPPVAESPIVLPPEIDLPADGDVPETIDFGDVEAPPEAIEFEPDEDFPKPVDPAPGPQPEFFNLAEADFLQAPFSEKGTPSDESHISADYTGNLLETAEAILKEEGFDPKEKELAVEQFVEAVLGGAEETQRKEFSEEFAPREPAKAGELMIAEPVIFNRRNYIEHFVDAAMNGETRNSEPRGEIALLAPRLKPALPDEPAPVEDEFTPVEPASFDYLEQFVTALMDDEIKPGSAREEIPLIAPVAEFDAVPPGELEPAAPAEFGARDYFVDPLPDDTASGGDMAEEIPRIMPVEEDEREYFITPLPDVKEDEAAVEIPQSVPVPEFETALPAEPEPKDIKPPKGRAYSVPVDGLLTAYPDGKYWVIDAETERAATLLQETLNEFSIQADVTGIKKGPVITMFEILPAPGVKLSRIVSLQDNIALRLAASSVRIVAPIPGKHAVGIEVPNKKRAIVSFREIIETGDAQFKKMTIPAVLGKDITGEAQIIDLAKTPHMLIAGATGSGKSVCVNSLILSILYTRAPSEVKMILIDPKIVELKLYNDIPHLLTPVITEPKRAFQALQYCLCEMERRYSLLDSMGVRDIISYNQRIVERRIATEKLPSIVIIIDEFADLMATTGKELESTVARLAAMSRAVGIHLVLATQRPSIDVITGLIKANIPTRVAFMVASKTDSRIIIDQAGAEKLLGKGDMLYSSAADPFPVRIQGTFVSDNEVESVADYVKQLGEPEYIDDEIFVDDEEDDVDPDLFGDGPDPLYDKALEIVVQAGKASASYVQRRLKIGYNRAARLIEEMEHRGIVGPANGSKPRDIVHLP